MAIFVSGVFKSILVFTKNWLVSPECVALFVLVLFLFNCLRLVRSIFVCFCRWKYKTDKKNGFWFDKSSKNVKIPTCNIFKESGGFRQYCHETKTDDMAAFSIQGRRKTMEDRFNNILHNFENDYSVYAVFDGHGGEFAAEFVEEQLFRGIQREFNRGSLQPDADSIQQVVTSVVKNVDAQLVCLSRDRLDLSGTTGLIVVQVENTLVVANIGDSRAVMCDGHGRTIAMSTDHKPCDPKEQKRIVEAGGFVTFNGVWRVAGVLATSRAFGDYPLKQRKFVTVEPEYSVYNIAQADPHFLVLATDGLWDVFSNEDAVNFISERLDEPHFGAKSLALQAYYRGSLDNITVMVVNIRRKRALQRKYHLQADVEKSDDQKKDK